MKSNVILTGLVAILMVACVVPFATSDDSDALIGNSSDMSLNTNSAIIYVTGGTTSVDLTITAVPTGYNASSATWARNDIGDGIDAVALSATGGSTITVTANDLNGSSVKSVEVVATIMVVDEDTEEEVAHTASAVIVVYPSPSTTATSFHYYVKIDQSAIPAGVSPQTTGFTDNHTISDFYNGFWIEVKQSQFNGTDWNAMTAFQWYCNTYGWNCSASGGWISTILNLGTYSGDNGVWNYWAQYHAVGNSWAFNNTTMNYMTSASDSYIGLIFWGSPDANTMPDFPGYPQASA